MTCATTGSERARLGERNVGCRDGRPVGGHLRPPAAARDAFTAVRLSRAELHHRPFHLFARSRRSPGASSVADGVDKLAEHREGIEREQHGPRVRIQHALLFVHVEATRWHRSAVEAAGGNISTKFGRFSCTSTRKLGWRSSASRIDGLSEARPSRMRSSDTGKSSGRTLSWAPSWSGSRSRRQREGQRSDEEPHEL